MLEVAEKGPAALEDNGTGMEYVIAGTVRPCMPEAMVESASGAGPAEFWEGKAATRASCAVFVEGPAVDELTADGGREVECCESWADEAAVGISCAVIVDEPIVGRRAKGGMRDACILEGANEKSADLEGEGIKAESIIAAAVAAGVCTDETTDEDGDEIGCAEGWAGEAAARTSCASGGKPNTNELLPLNTDAG